MRYRARLYEKCFFLSCAQRDARMRRVFDERTSMRELSLRLNFVLHVLAAFVMPLLVVQVVFAFETAPRVEWRAEVDVDDVAL
ncbi:MAG: hypothetical protein RIR10_104, partial [Planctomycetota bacterium]